MDPSFPLPSPAPSSLGDDSSQTSNIDTLDLPTGGRKLSAVSILTDDDDGTLGSDLRDGSKSRGSSPGGRVRHRKSHAKSKQGCYDCKHRRIKCDETKPSCKNCDKKGLRCEYPKPTPRPITFAEPVILTPSSIGETRKKKKPKQTEQPATETRLTRQVALLSSPLCRQVSSPEDRLFATFDDEAALTLMLPEIWRGSYMEMAKKFDFARFSLLMFSSAHLSRSPGPLESQRSFRMRMRIQELEYREMALQTMREQMSSHTSNEFYDAILGASLLLAFHSCAFSHLESLDPSNDAFLFMLNSVKQVVKQIWLSRHRSAFKNLFAMPLAPEPDESLIYGFENLFIDDDNAIDTPMTGDGESSKSNNENSAGVDWKTETKYLPDYQIYRRVLASLLPLIRVVYNQEGLLAADVKSGLFCSLVAWPSLQPDRFFELIRMNDPKSLILAAHYYAALMKLDASDNFWLRDRPREMCRAICYKLGSAYRPWLQLPLDMLDSVAGVRRLPSPEDPEPSSSNSDSDSSTLKKFRVHIPLKPATYTVLERKLAEAQQLKGTDSDYHSDDMVGT